jgi:hypothetical protein
MFRFLDKMFDAPTDAEVKTTAGLFNSSLQAQPAELVRDKAHGFETAAMEVIQDGVNSEAANDNEDTQEPGNPTTGLAQIIAQINNMSAQELQDLQQGVIPKRMEQ